ncbi:MAG: hypothetical protein ACRCYY_18630 [Trueperaceae bacterium]
MNTTMNIEHNNKPIKVTEMWYQDIEDSDLWFGEHGVILNTAALDEREVYFEIIRVPQQPNYAPRDNSVHA